MTLFLELNIGLTKQVKGIGEGNHLFHNLILL